MIKEVIIVEGKADIAKIRQSVDADVVATEGFNLRREVLGEIEFAYKQRGIIIMTDPDSAGERIRKFLTKRFPEARHAFVPKEDATANDDIGIEQASPEAIRTALEKVRTLDWNPSNEFSGADLITARVSGTAAAAARRARLGAMLGVGYANAKTFLLRLNHYGVSREEFTAALAALDKESEAEA